MNEIQDLELRLAAKAKKRITWIGVIILIVSFLLLATDKDLNMDSRRLYLLGILIGLVVAIIGFLGLRKVKKKM